MQTFPRVVRQAAILALLMPVGCLCVSDPEESVPPAVVGLEDRVHFEVVALRHASATQLSNQLGLLLHRDVTTQVVADARSNSLLIGASASRIAELRELIARLDVDQN